MFWVGWHLHPAPPSGVESPTAAATRLEEILPGPGPTGPGVPLDGTPAPPVRLVTAGGRSLSLQELLGRVTVLAFVDPSGGPETTLAAEVVRDAWADLGPRAASAAAVAVGVRAVPPGDVTVAHDAPWVAALGPPEALGRLRTTYHVAVETVGHSVAYTPALVVLDRRGRAARLLILSSGVSAARQGDELAQVIRMLAGPAAGSH